MPKKQVMPPVDTDDMARFIQNAINGMDKAGEKVAFMLDGEEETPMDFTDFISTGSTMLDIAISNRPYGGIATGRITQITGLEGTGKSLMCAHIIANTINRGGIGVFIDTENAYSKDFFATVGIKPDKMVLLAENRLEKIFEYITSVIESVRLKQKSDRLVTIVVDSVAAATTESEVESDFNKNGYNTEKAQVLGKALRKITNMIGRQKITLVFTNQLRYKMDAFAFSQDKWTSPGGKALDYHSTTIIRLSKTGTIKNKETDQITGTKVKARVTKNRVGPPEKTVEFEIYYDRGVDDYNSWVSALVDVGALKKSGGWYRYVDLDTGEITEPFLARDFPQFLEEDQERKSKLYQKICDGVIMLYKSDPENSVVVEVSDAEEIQPELLTG